MDIKFSINIEFIVFILVTTLIFTLLKLFHQIDWSWLWVTSPVWLPFAAIGIIFVLYFIAALFGMWVVKVFRK